MLGTGVILSRGSILLAGGKIAAVAEGTSPPLRGR
jgi:hypothetical protein